jgi:phosphate transport system substrate-binding protein
MSGAATNSPPPPADQTPAEMKARSAKSPTMAYIAVAVVIVIIVIVVLAGWQFGGWFKNSSTPASKSTPTGCTPPGAVALTGAGSTFVNPLMTVWETDDTATQVNYESVGSGTGISDITAKTVDFGASDAPLNVSQHAAVPGILEMPEAAGGVTVIYNVPGLTAPLNVNGSVLAQIFLGTITNWNNTPLQTLNPHVVLPVDTISVQYRSDGSGTTYAFTQFLSKDSATWASQVGYGTVVVFPVRHGDKGSSGIAGTVSTTPYTIGYVDPTGAFILPSVANTASAIVDSQVTLPAGNGNWSGVSLINAPGAGDYPITTFTYLMFYPDPGVAYGSSYTLQKAENLVNFLNWTINQGQSYSEGLYYDVLPANVVAADEVTIKSMTFNGAAVPMCG